MSMTMNPLPPQAYTKETLLKSYAWLQNQPNHIKELASTPDILVSLYIKAKINGESALETPSIQNFKNELKSLAGMMGEFENQNAAPSNQNTQLHQAQNGENKELRQAKDIHQPSQSIRPSLPPSNTTVNPTSSGQTIAPHSQFSTTIGFSSSTNNAEVDALSVSYIQEIRCQFNLSCDHEALRMLIATGYKKLKNSL